MLFDVTPARSGRSCPRLDMLAIQKLSRQCKGLRSVATLNECDVDLTMGCSTLELATSAEVRDWALDNRHGQDIDRVQEIRGEIEGRVTDLVGEFFRDDNVRYPTFLALSGRSLREDSRLQTIKLSLTL